MSDTVKTYFAAADVSEIGARLVGRLKRCIDKADSGQREQQANAYRHYYGRDAGQGVTTGVTRGGEQGELALVRVNKARAIAKAYLALVTAGKVTWRPVARNGDASATATTSLASAILEDFWKRRRFSQNYLWWVEQAIAFADSYLFPEWDLGAGPPLAPAGGGMLLQGDITIHNVLPFDTFVNEAVKSSADVQWRYTRLFKNRFDIASLAEQIGVLGDGGVLVFGPQARELVLGSSGDGSLGEDRIGDNENELVPLWYFHHQPSPSLPQGREVVFLSGRCVFVDRALTATYEAPGPVYRLSADEMFDTPNGWSQFWEMLGAQEISDAINTTLATIITTLGNPSIAVEKGSDERPNKLPSGYRPWLYNKGGQPPKPIQLAEFPPDALKYGEAIDASMPGIMGMNDVAMGQPDTAQMNAQAFAVLASMAVQNAGPFQSNALDGLAKVGTGILKTLGKKVSRERELRVVGNSSESLYSTKKYSGKDLEAFDSVVIDIGNPLEQTPSGRLQLLQLYQQVPGAVVTIEQVQQVVETGKLDPAMRRTRDEKRLIDSEYEALQRGESPMVHTSQNHPLHYRENYAVLLSEAALGNPKVITVTQAHCDQHYLEYFGVAPEVDPLRLPRQRFLLGQGPEPMPPMMGPPPPGDTGAPPPPPGEPSEALAPPGMEPPPDMPTNPLTGGEFEPATAGGLGGPAIQ